MWKHLAGERSTSFQMDWIAWIPSAQAEMSPIKGEQEEARHVALETWRCDFYIDFERCMFPNIFGKMGIL